MHLTCTHSMCLTTIWFMCRYINRTVFTGWNGRESMCHTRHSPRTGGVVMAIPTSTGQRTAAWRVMIVFLFFPLLILKIELCSRWTKYCLIY